MAVTSAVITSQGAAVSFAGSPIGKLLRVVCSAGSAVTQSVTSVESPVEGAGSSARVFMERDCTAVDPGSVTVRLLGMPPWSVEDIGSRGQFSATTPGGSVAADAILASFEFEASVGDLVTGSAEFVFTGA